MNQAPFTFAVMIAMSVGLLHAQYTAHTFYHPQTELLGTQPFRQLDEVSSAHKRYHVSLEGVYFKTNDEQVLGNYFGYKDETNSIRNQLGVDTDSATALFPQQIIHDSAHADSFTDPSVNPLEGTLTFRPSIERYGCVLTHSVSISEIITASVSLPFLKQIHRLGLTVSGQTPQMVEGAYKTVADFFSEMVEQVAPLSPDQQDRLLSGKIQNVQSISGLCDITCTLNVTLSRTSTVHAICGPFLIIPTTEYPTAEYLFEPVMGTGGHFYCGIHGVAYFALWSKQRMNVGALFLPHMHEELLHKKFDLLVIKMMLGSTFSLHDMRLQENIMLDVFFRL